MIIKADRERLAANDVLLELQRACGANLTPKALEAIRNILTRFEEGSPLKSRDWAAVRAATELSRIVRREQYTPRAGVSPELAWAGYEAIVTGWNREISDSLTRWRSCRR